MCVCVCAYACMRVCVCVPSAQVFIVVLKMEGVRVTIAGERVKLQGEVLHGIRVVKFYGTPMRV